MIAGVRLKVCGLTSLADALMAAGEGADYLGFNFYPPSPRHITLAQYRAWSPRLPAGKRVAVAVEPTPEEWSVLRAAGFDYFQIHFRPEVTEATLAAWSSDVGPARLWLAPKLQPGTDVPAEWLPLARTFLIDTFHPEKFGGTGRTGDWAKFARHRAAHPDRQWILSGGLAPDNIAAAVRASGADFVDVNSGVESAPGRKDQAKLNRLAAALRALSA